MLNSIPKPTWNPDHVENASLIAARFSEYTNDSRAFVVYKYGTTVFSDTNNELQDQDYDAMLTAVAHQSPDFSVLPMQDGNFLVRFTGSVCGLVIGKFYAESAEEIREKIELGGLLPSELIVKDGEMHVPADHYYIGLYARAKLYRDLEEKVISIRYLPSSRINVSPL